MVLRLSDEEFYSLTPRQYHLLLDRKLEEVKHSEWLTGVVASAVANWSFGGPKEPLQPKDFPLALLREDVSKPTRINRKKVAEQIRAAFQKAMKRQNVH